MTSRATLGYAAINRVPMCTNQGFCNFLPGDGLNAKFLVYWLTFAKPEIKRRAAGSTFLEVSKAAMRALPMNLPPLPEQKKIAAILRSMDDAIQATQAVIDQTRKLKQGLLQQLLTRGIGHTRFKQTEIGEVPMEWAVRQIGEVGKVITGSTPSTKIPTYWNGDIPFITPGDLSDTTDFVSIAERTVTEEGAASARFLPSGSVLVTCIGSTIGKTGIAGQDCVINQQINAIVCEQADPYYIYLAVSALRQRIVELAGRHAVPIVNKSLFSSLAVPFPPLDEQREIADRIKALADADAANASHLTRLTELKFGLMAELLTGRKRVEVTA